MPSNNHARDAGADSRFKVLQTLSVVITLAHTLVAGGVVLRVAGLL
ncbi:MAG: hypothetical protein AAF290_07555 [Pseudomonadota bacterium]